MQNKKAVKTDPIEEKKKEFFSKKFSPLLENWQEEQKAKGLPHKQEDFGALVYSNRNTVSNWKNGKVFPEMGTLERIAKAFNVDVSVFFPQSRSERWENDSPFVSEFADLCNDYCQAIGLDVQFLKTIISITDFENNFPVWSPIIWKQSFISLLSGEMPKAERQEVGSSAPVREDVKCFQIEKNGKRLLMSFEDLDYIKDLQDTVSDFIEFQYYKRKKEMEQEVQKVSEASIIHSKNGVMTFKPLSDEEMKKYDKYFIGRYADKDEWIKRMKEIVENGRSKKA